MTISVFMTMADFHIGFLWMIVSFLATAGRARCCHVMLCLHDSEEVLMTGRILAAIR